MSNDIDIDKNGAKIGWSLLAIVFGSVATIYAQNTISESKDFTREMVIPLEKRIAKLEFEVEYLKSDQKNLEIDFKSKINGEK